MISTHISNIKNIHKAYTSVRNRIHNLIRNLKNDYEEFTRGNVYYKKVGVGKIILSIMIDIVLIFLVSVFSSTLEATKFNVDQLDSGNVLYFIVSRLLLFLCIYCIYNTGVMLYSKKIERYAARIARVERRAEKALERLKDGKLDNQLLRAAIHNEDITIDSENDLGREIVRIREGFMSTNQKAHNVKKCVRIGVSAILYLSLLLYMLVKVNGKPAVDPASGILISLLCVLAAAAINVTQFNAGEYMGKFSKLIGSVMALVYGLVLYLCLKKSFTIPAFEIPWTGFAAKINVACIVIPIIQTLGIILTVCLSHYGLEKEKWENGFEVPMAYSFKPDGNKFTVLVRGGIAIVSAFLLCILITQTPVKEFVVIASAILWYCSNSLMKPRGSYLYTFWGRGKCIANEFVMAAMVISAALCGRGTISQEELIFMAVAFGDSFLIAGLATFINNRI